MNLVVEQVAALAPDDSSLAAGKKLGSAKSWKNTGQSDSAVWGECQGSALYQVRVDLSDLGYKCTCPSRKLPCKHVLGLLLLAVNSPSDLPKSESPEWVTDWLTKRASRAKQREEKKEGKKEPADPAARAKRAEQRQERVVEGLERLDLWLHDLIRNGLAGLEAQPPSFWEDPAKRLVDAQAPALASRLRRLGEIPGSNPDWPRQLLGRLGRLELLIHAFRRIDSLDSLLQTDIRQLIGWTINQDELTVQGEVVTDHWAVLGQIVEEEDRFRVQRSWLWGEKTGRSALVLQFSAVGQPYPEQILPGTKTDGDLLYWPSAFPQRAKFNTRRGESIRISKSLSGCATLEEFLAQTAGALTGQPWLDRFFGLLKQVTPIPKPRLPWLVRDSNGQAMPLAKPESWKLLALSGGRPVDLAAEWDGERLLPLSVFVEGEFHLLQNSARQDPLLWKKS